MSGEGEGEGEGVGGCGEAVGYRSASRQASSSSRQTHGLTNDDGEEENI